TGCGRSRCREPCRIALRASDPAVVAQPPVAFQRGSLPLRRTSMGATRRLPEPQLITPGAIARKLDQPIHRVLHVLATRPAIRPAARAGRLRLYDHAAIGQVRSELARIDAARDPEGGAA